MKNGKIQVAVNHGVRDYDNGKNKNSQRASDT